MKWIINTPATIGDLRNRKLFAWLPVRVKHWDKSLAMSYQYTVWLEHYYVTEEYKQVTDKQGKMIEQWIIKDRQLIV